MASEKPNFEKDLEKQLVIKFEKYTEITMIEVLFLLQAVLYHKMSQMRH